MFGMESVINLLNGRFSYLLVLLRGSEAGIIGDAPVPFAEELLQT